MASTLTLAQLESYQILLDQGDIGGFYTLMQSNGYGYAGWARGVAEENSIAGLAALDFLSDSAMLGMTGLDPMEVTPEQFQNIKADMAQGYLDTLKSIASGPGGVVGRDVTAEEVWQFHISVFQQNELNIESWTLHTPFTIVQDYFGDDELESFWQGVRDTGGEGVDAILGNMKISLLMYIASHGSMGTANASLANQWLDLVGFDGSVIAGLHGTLIAALEPFSTSAEVTLSRSMAELMFDWVTPPGELGSDVEIASIVNAINSVETARRYIDDVRQLLFGPGTSPTPGGTLDATMQAIMESVSEIVADQSLSSAFAIESLVGTSPSYFEQKAAQSVAYRYALVTLTPFVLLGDESVYAPHNTNGELEIYDPLTAAGGLTETWIADRAEMLAVKNFFDQHGIDYSNRPTALDGLVPPSIEGDHVYHDLALGVRLEINRDEALSWRPRHVVFGDDGDNVIGAQDWRWSDRLYGGGGDDTLVGGGGNDHLEGGQGGDVYRFSHGDGDDTIVDHSEGNSIEIAGVVLGELNSVSNANNLYQNDDGSITLERTEKGFIVTYYDSNGRSGTINVTGAPSNFGLILSGYEEEEPEADSDSLVIGDGDVENSLGDEVPIKVGYWERAEDPSQAFLNDLPMDFDAGLLRRNEAGASYFDGGDKADRLVSDEGFYNPFLYGRGGDDTIIMSATYFGFAEGGEGDDYLKDNGGAFLFGEHDGFDETVGDGSGADTLISASSETARMDGGGGDDIIINESGVGWLFGGSGDDVLQGGSGIDIILGDGRLHLEMEDPPFGALTATGHVQDIMDDQLSYDDIIDAGDGDNTVIGGAGDDIIVAGSGNDTIAGDISSMEAFPGDSLSLTEEVPQSMHGDDVINAGAGNDTVLGGGGNDVILGGAGDDVLYGEDPNLPGLTPGDNTLGGGSGNDALYGGTGDDVLSGDAGDDTVLGDGGSDQLEGGSGNDFLQDYWNAQSVDSNTLSGGAGNDTLLTGIGTDTLLGGAGNDTLFAGAGNDVLYGGGQTDYLVGEQGDDILVGGAGTDFMYGGAGNDTYQFSAGDGLDTVQDRQGNNHILVDTTAQGAGIYRTPNNVIISYGTGDAIYLSSSTLHSSTVSFSGEEYQSGRLSSLILSRQAALGSALLVSGSQVSTTGASTMMAGTQAVSTGANPLTAWYGGQLVAIDSSATGIDSQDPSTWLLNGAVALTGAVVFYTNASGDVLAGVPDGEGGYLAPAGAETEHTLLPDGELLSRQPNFASEDDLLATPGEELELPEGAEGDTSGTNADDEVINGGAGDDVVDGGVGMDLIRGLEGTDSLDGGAGKDILFGGAGDDTLLGGAGDDFLYGEDGVDLLQGDEGDDYLNGGTNDDVLEGGNGNDLLIGGAGNDTLTGGAGSDRYLFDIGHGQDVIHNSGSTGFSTIAFADAIRPQDVMASRDGDDLLLETGSNGDSVRVTDYFVDGATSANAVDQIEFSGAGIVWSIDDIKARVLIGNGADNVLQGYDNSDDLLRGKQGNDLLSGASGDDVLEGGQGDDTMQGGAGNDTYIVNPGEGHDEILDLAGENNTLQFGTDITAEQVKAIRNGDDLFLSLQEGNASVTVTGFFGSGGETLSSILFDDGGQWGPEQIRQQVLIGTDASDNLVGYDSDDNLTGNRGDDQLTGNGGDDTYLFASGDGQDIIITGETDAATTETVRFDHTVSDQDVDVQRDGDDLILAYGGDDTITVRDFFLQEGNGVTAIDRVEFDNGTVWSVDDLKAAVLVGDAQDNTLEGYSSDDLLTGNGGDDTLIGGDGDDVYRFASGDGEDVINDAAGSQDRIELTDVNPADALLRREGDDLLIKNTVSGDVIRVLGQFSTGAGEVSPTGINSIIFADATQWDYEAIKQQALAGTDAADEIHGHADDDDIDAAQGDDTVYGGAGNDTISGGLGQDMLHGEDGDDEIHGGDDVDTIFGGAGNDLLHGDAGDDIVEDYVGENIIHGGSGDDHLSGTGELYGEAGADTLTGSGVLDGSDGNDHITGEGSDSLSGGSGDDVLIAYSERDAQNSNTLKGGTGDDSLFGSFGDDTYRFGLGDGHDILTERRQGEDYSDVNPSTDTIEFGPGISQADLQFERHGDDLLIAHTNGTDSVLVTNWYRGATDHFKINAIEFDDGSNLTLDDIENLAVTYGTEADDTMSGYRSKSDTIRAGAGNDQVWGGDGDDALYGGAGDDSLDGDAGDDLLEGGVGSDTLAGGEGDDVYRFAAGDGSDVIDDAAGGQDRIELTDVNPTDVLLRREGEDLLIRNTASGDIIRVLGQFSTQAGVVSLSGINSIVFADATQWDYEEIKQQSLAGTEAADEIHGHADDDNIDAAHGDDIVHGGAGNDTITGGLGQDTLHGEDGDDEIHGGDEADTIFGGAGNDQLHGDAGNDIIEDYIGQNTIHGGVGDDQLTGGGYLYGEEGADTLTGSGLLDGGAGDDQIVGQGSDTLIGGSGEDIITAYSEAFTQNSNTLEGGIGDDTLFGSFGNDIYRFGLGDGQDILTERRQGEDYSNVNPSTDTIEFGAGISQADLRFERHGDDLLIAHTNGTDSVLVTNWYSGATDHFKINNIQFDDGSNLTLSDIENLAVTHGTEADDTMSGYRSNSDTIRAGDGNDQVWGRGGDDALYGEAGDDYVDGDAGDDLLEGGAGSDTLVGRAGSDTLVGGTGDDSYVYTSGGGSDLIVNGDGGYDGLFFQDGIDRDRLSFERDGDDLIVMVDSDPDQSVRVQDHFLGGDHAIDFVQPDGGFLLDTTEINQIVAAGGGEHDAVIEGTENAEQLVGTSGKDLIKGLAGDDTLFGLGNDDELLGGEGNDYLSGGNGSGGGSGDDTLIGGEGNDTLDGEDGDDLLIGGSGDDNYYYSAGAGADIIDNTGGGYDGVFFQNGVDQERLTFLRDGDDLVIVVDGDVSQSVRVQSHFLGGDFAIDFVQPDGDALLDTAAINDLVDDGDDGGGNGGDFDNEIDGTANGEQLVGTSGRDLVQGLAGDDTLFGLGGNDELRGGDGNDYLSGGNGSGGGSGADTLVGGAGDDVLNGEDGHDMLVGGLGNDQYYYTQGGGVDTVDNTGGGFDGVFFLDGVGRNQLSFHQDGDDLVILVDSDPDQQVRVLEHFLGNDTISYVQPDDGGPYIPTADIPGLLEALPVGAQASGMVTTGAAQDREAPSLLNWDAISGSDVIGSGEQGAGSIPAEAITAWQADRFDGLVNAMAAFGAEAGGDMYQPGENPEVTEPVIAASSPMA